MRKSGEEISLLSVKNFMPLHRWLVAVRQKFTSRPTSSQKYCLDEDHQASFWQEAQKYEQGYWVQLIHQELNISNRDQMVGFRLCEGRIHLSHFGLEWRDWMYSQNPPIISGKLLDVGSSVVSVFEKCRSVSVVAIDPSLQRLTRVLPEIVVLGKVHNCEYRCCYIQDVTETDFDIVWCNNVLDHTDNWREIIRHFARVLKKSGLLFLGVDVRSDTTLLDTGHISAFTADDILTEVTASGFEMVWQSLQLDLSQYRFCLRAMKL